MVGEAGSGGSWFQRFLLPGFALKAVIIGGGYATGRELAEYFVPAGPWGGLAGMLLATLIWSVVAALTFALARQLHAYDYRSFFQQLLGPGWVLFEAAYLIFVVLILAVFGAAAGAIGAATFGWPELMGAVVLAAAILFATAFGEAGVERLFKYASMLIYAVYALFLFFALTRFGDRIGAGFAAAGPPPDALIAGAIAGPLTMLPAILFFVAMMAFYPGIGDETLPSDFLLRQMAVPGFHLLFQLMIFTALLESGVGAIHAINERIAGAFEARGRAAPGTAGRALIGAAILAGCMFVAARVGLVDLIASGYRILAWLFLAVYVVPLLGIGTYRLVKRGPSSMQEVRP
jgi:uncharacterized membrane protein YkvI